MRVRQSHSAKLRSELIKRFSQNGATALVSGLNLINRGFNIVAANHVIITDLEYSPESTDQGEDRVHRTGQDKEVYVYYVLSAGTIDYDILQVVTQKRAAINHAIDQKAVYTSIAELMLQLDLRNPVVAVARRLVGLGKAQDIEVDVVTEESTPAPAFTRQLSFF